MNNVQSDLEALLEIQKDFEIIKELEAKVNKLKNKQATVEKQCKKEIPNTPAIDHTESQRLEKKKKDISVNAGGGYAFGLLAFCAVIAIMGLFLGYGFDKIWCVLGAACLFIGGFAGYVGVAVGCGLCALIGWNVWVHAAIHWQIVLLILAALSVTMGCLLVREDKKAKLITEQLQLQIDEQKLLEKRQWEIRKAEHDKKVADIKEENRALSEKMNQETRAELNEVQAQIRSVKARITDNPVLDNSDKTEEVVAYVISQLQRKRAVSLTDALLQYDAMIKQQDRDRFERETRQLQMDMERMWRDEQIRREADAQFNQAMHNLKVEKEQRRQTELLEEINRKTES